jgi:hypothetical protein
VVHAVTFASSSNDEHAGQTALIRPDDGTMMQARIRASLTVKVGQRVKVVAYERAFSATRTYEVVAVDGSK